MNPPQRVALALGVLALGLLLAFRPYDVCGAAMCSVVYAASNHPPAIDPQDGDGPDGGLLAAQLLLVVLLAATAVMVLKRPVRRGRVVGLLVGMAVVAAFVGTFATSFPMAAFDTAMIGDGIVGIGLAAVALAGRRGR